MKRKYILISLVTIIIIGMLIFTFKFITTSRNKDKANISKLVVEYHDYIMKRNYSKALNLMDYEDHNKYIQDLQILNQSQITMLPYPNNEQWVVENIYDKHSKFFIVKCSGKSIYMNESYGFFEDIYVKKINGVYKISFIKTDDKFYRYRGSKLQTLN